MIIIILKLYLFIGLTLGIIAAAFSIKTKLSTVRDVVVTIGSVLLVALTWPLAYFYD